jgi:hypothetical protein
LLKRNNKNETTKIQKIIENVARTANILRHEGSQQAMIKGSNIEAKSSLIPGLELKGGKGEKRPRLRQTSTSCPKCHSCAR